MNLYQTPILQDTARTGKAKFWQGFAVAQGTGAVTYTTHWQEGSVVQQSALTEVHGKNLGRANATTPHEQAIAEVKAAEAKQRKRGYAEPGTHANIRLLPMLAHKFADKRKNATWPAFWQPKLDGFRALTDGTEFWSRRGERFPAACVEHLRVLLGQTVLLDGEFMVPAPYTFQDVKSFTSKPQPEQHLLEYHVFDFIPLSGSHVELPYIERQVILNAFFRRTDLPPNVRQVRTEPVSMVSDFLRLHNEAVAAGYEGSIYRSETGVYQPKHRSPDLLKHKDFQDQEFPIDEVLEGTGKDAGTAKFRCRAPNGRPFVVVPNGSYASRKQMWVEREHFPGKSLTVEFQNWTDDGVPRFPRGKAVREE